MTTEAKPSGLLAEIEARRARLTDALPRGERPKRGINSD
jgi:hypothetical protein